MQYLELSPGIVLMVFPDYWNMRKIKDLCLKKRCPVLFSWERRQVKQYQAHQWVLQIVSGRYKNYELGRSREPYVKANDSLESAIRILEAKIGQECTHLLVVRSF